IISQGEIVANSLADYLNRHPAMEERISKNGQRIFYTTDSPEDFDRHANIFFGNKLHSIHVALSSLNFSMK
ncbi:MAG: glutamate racemase, partial [Chitinophagales bacterium]